MDEGHFSKIDHKIEKKPKKERKKHLDAASS
jgi:hypothetical protein